MDPFKEPAQERSPELAESDLDAAWDNLEPEVTSQPSGESVAQQPSTATEGDPAAELAYRFLCDVLREMQMTVSARRRRSEDDHTPDETRFDIVGRDAGRIIGKKGQVLAALQYLVNRVVNRPGRPRHHIVLDAEGYRERREDSLANMARRLGAQAASEGKVITFEPMSPRDRRVVHLALATFPNVMTRSDGEGGERRVRIIPVRK